MKKIIPIFSLLAAILIFTDIFQMFNQRYYEYLIDPKAPNEEEMFMMTLSFDQPTETHQHIDSFLKKGISFFTITFTQRIDIQTEVMNLLVYSSNGSIEKNIYYLETKNQDLNKVHGYASTLLEDSNRTLTIDYLDEKYYGNDYIQFNVYPLSQLPYLNIEKSTINCVYSGNAQSKESVYTHFEGILVGEILELHRGQTDSSYYSLLNLFLYCILFLFFSILFIEKRRNIAIYKLQGISIFHIYYKQFINTIFHSGIAYLLGLIVAYLMLIHRIFTLSIAFLKELIAPTCIFGALLIIISSILLILIAFVHPTESLKIRGNNSNISGINIILKSILCILLIEPLVNQAISFYQYSLAYYNLIQRQNDNYLSVSALTEATAFENSIAIEQKLISFFSQNEALYIDFKQFDIEEFSKSMDIPTNTVPYLIVNQAYLDYLGKLNNFDSDSDYLLVPIENQNKLHQLNLNEYPDKIFWYDETVHCKDLNVYSVHHVINPIILVVHNTDRIQQVSYRSFYLDLNKENKYNQKEFESLQNYAVFITTQSVYQRTITRLRTVFLKTLWILLIYVFMLICFTYQNCYSFFYHNKRKIAVLYLCGDKHRKIILEFILYNLLIWILPSFLMITVQHISATLVFLFVSINILVEFFFNLVLMHQFQKNSVSLLLKEE